MPNAKTTPKPPNVVERNASLDPLFGINRSAFAAWAHSMSRLSNEMAQFMQLRLQEDSAMWEKLATCSKPADFFKCQSEFAAKAGTDYADEAQKLSRLTHDFAHNYGFGLFHTSAATD